MHAFVWVVFVSSAGIAQQPTGAIVGTVRDSAGAAVPGVDVSVPAVVRTRTDSAGRFRLAGVRPGTAVIHLRRMGFLPKTVTAEVASGRIATLVVSLEPFAQELPGVVVQDEERHAREMMQEFYHRKEQGFGYFVTRAEIEKRDPAVLSDMMRQIPGARLIPLRGGGHATLRFARAVSSPGRDCPPQYWVDGVMAYGLNIDDLSPRDIEGIEIYQGASVVPAEYNTQYGTTACGVVLIWSRVPGT